MSISIAFSGKGGTGKTTLTGMLIRYLIDKKKNPILAVDADPNYNLNEVLGVDVDITLGGVREQMKTGDVPSGMDKTRFIHMKVQQAVEEKEDFDLIVMGQPEGAGCYCAANTLLTEFLSKLTGNYSYIVTDNEAGMEHISRLTTHNVDYLLIVADPSRRGLQAAERIKTLADSLHIGVSKVYLILNNVKNEPSDKLLEMINQSGLELLGYIQEDETIHEFDLNGKPTFKLPKDNQALQKAYSLFDQVLNSSS